MFTVCNDANAEHICPRQLLVTLSKTRLFILYCGQCFHVCGVPYTFLDVKSQDNFVYPWENIYVLNPFIECTNEKCCNWRNVINWLKTNSLCLLMANLSLCWASVSLSSVMLSVKSPLLFGLKLTRSACFSVNNGSHLGTLRYNMTAILWGKWAGF